VHVTFGMHGDGGTWPEHGGEGAASFGAPVVGPGGLLALLEGAFGLAGPETSSAERIVAWQAALTAVDHQRRFWHRSLATDGWATARLLLGWRDDLLMSGWRSEREWQGARLADLAAAERAAEPSGTLRRGVADRLRAVEACLQTSSRTPFASLAVIGRRSDLPAAWRRLLTALAAAGVSVRELAPHAAADPATSLGRLQRWLLGVAHDPAPYVDDSVIWAQAGSSVTAGEVMAGWLAAWPAGRSVALVAADDAFAWDAALHAAGLPRFGATPASPHRGGLQLLRLAFDAAWQPIDVRTLLTLLTLPTAPIPAAAATPLAAALTNTPGFGEAWQTAWMRVAEAECDRCGDAAIAAANVAGWRAWLEPPRADPLRGMACSDATAICERVGAWANEVGQGATAAAAAEVAAALAAHAAAFVPKAWLDRLIEHATQAGARDPLAVAEAAAARRAVTHPGGIWASADAVVWWNYRDGGERPVRAPWSAAERAELTRAGCALDDVGHAAAAQSAAWERAVLNARRLVLVSYGTDVDSHEAHHPLAHRLQPGFARWGRVVALDDAFATAAFPFAGAILPRTAHPQRDLPAASATWVTPVGFAARARDRRESATSLTSLLGCPLQWALRHVARLRPGRERSLPGTEQLLGSLAHALAERIFPAGAPPTPADAEAIAKREMERFVDARALLLRLPTHAIEFTQAAWLLPRALGKLAEMLHVNDLRVIGTEQTIDLTTPPLRGSIDLLAATPAGGRVVVDLKWTRRAQGRREELESGTAVQLATYVRSLRSGDLTHPAQAGYFLLRQGIFLTTPDAGLQGAVVPDALGMEATWAGVAAGWEGWLTVANEGTLPARGVASDDPTPVPAGALSLEAPCRYCDFQVLCRKKEVADADA
jgi:ATP-dependent helicase/nuclease subunit B